MPFGDYEKIRVVGTGSYGEIWLVKSHSRKRQYVIKEIPLSNKSKREQKAALKEVQLLSTLQHPNIVAYKESFTVEEGKLQIVMDFCSGGDLYSILRARKSNYLEERQVVEWTIQIALALRYLHERNILHRDLKTQNIFITKSQIIKLGDFGISRVLDSPGDMATTIIGTPYYMSPELFSNKPYNHKSDVWSFGCCIYEMLSLHHAFDASSMHSLVFKILRGKFPPLPRQYSAQLVDIVKQTLELHPEKRPSIRRFLATTYIRQNIQKLLDSIKKKTMSSKAKPFMCSSTSSSSDIRSSSDDRAPRLLLPPKDPAIRRPPSPLIERAPSPPRDQERSLSARERRRLRLSESERETPSAQEKPILIPKKSEVIPKYAFLDSLRISRKRLMMKKEDRNLQILGDKPKKKVSDSDFSENSDVSELPANGEMEKLAAYLGNTLQTVEKQCEEQRVRPPLLPAGRYQSFRSSQPQVNARFDRPERGAKGARLEERISCLRNECIECLGEKLFSRVMNVISVCLGNDIETELIEILGTERTLKHIKLINELKFCYDMSTGI